MGKKNKTAGQAQAIGFWHMLRDVLVASINKGQFPAALLGLVVLSLIWRMPKEDVGRLVSELMNGLRSGWLLGYVLAGVALVCWYLHARYQRRLITGEMRRIAKERDALQSHTVGKRLGSSEGNK